MLEIAQSFAAGLRDLERTFAARNHFRARGFSSFEDHGWTLVYGKNSRDWRGTAVVFAVTSPSTPPRPCTTGGYQPHSASVGENTKYVASRGTSLTMPRESPCGIVTRVEGGFQSCENIRPHLEPGSHRDLGEQGAASRGRGFCPLSGCVEEERDLVTARSSSLTFLPRGGGRSTCSTTFSFR